MVDRATDGGWHHFDDFVAQRLPALYRYAYALTGNRHNAEDLVQEALTRTGATWWRIQRKDDPEGYIRTAMVRIMANRWRRPRRELLVASAPDRPAEDRDLTRVDDADQLDAALAELPPRMRAVLVLRYMEQLTEQEAAEVLGCSRGTVKSQASRALARLRAAAMEEEEHHG